MLKQLLYKIEVYVNLFLFNFKLHSFLKDREITYNNNVKQKKINVAYEFPVFFLEHIYFFLLALIPLKKKINFSLFYFLEKKDFITKIIKFIFLFNIDKILNKNKIEFINYHFYKKDYEDKINKIFQKLKNKKDVLKIEHKNYKIGKFIYQSYCREEYQPKLDFKDVALKKYIYQAFNYTDNALIFFKRKKYSHAFVTHAGYLKYNCFNLVAKSYGCKISIFSRWDNYRSIRFIDITKQLTQDENYHDYKKNFEKLKNKKKKIFLSVKELNQRNLSLKKNQRIHKFNVNSSFFDFNKYDKNPNKICILPPCMFDTLFHFKNNLFDEPYEWLEFVLKIAEKTKFSWYLKPHPDGHYKNKEVFDKLKIKYKSIKFIDPNISALSFKKSNFKSVFSYQTTGAHEYIHMGIPCILSGDNLQSSFAFGKPVKDKLELKKRILNANKINLSKKDEIYKFNYMVNFTQASNVKIYNFIKTNKNFSKIYNDLNQSYGNNLTTSSLGISNFFFNLNKIKLLNKNILKQDQINMIKAFERYLFKNRFE